MLQQQPAKVGGLSSFQQMKRPSKVIAVSLPQPAGSALPVLQPMNQRYHGNGEEPRAIATVAP